MVDFIHSFHDLVDRGHQEVGKVNLELEESVVSLPVEKMLEQFVLQKYTGLVSSLRFQQSPDPIFTTSKTRIRCYPGETRTCRVWGRKHLSLLFECCAANRTTFRHIRQVSLLVLILPFAFEEEMFLKWLTPLFPFNWPKQFFLQICQLGQGCTISGSEERVRR